MTKFLIIAAALVVFPLFVLAQVPTPDDPGAFVQFLINAAQAKQWALVGVVATIGLVALARKIGAKYVPFLGTRRGGALLALLGGIATAFTIPLIAGTPLSLNVIFDALLYGVGAAGGWTVVRRLVLGDGVVEAPAAPVAVQAEPLSAYRRM